MKNKCIIGILIILLFINCGRPEKYVTILQVPGKDLYCKIDIDGISVLPSGRFATPVGKQLRISNDPYGMSISPDGNKAVTLHNGVFTIIDLNSINAIRVPSYDEKIPSPLSGSETEPNKERA